MPRMIDPVVRPLVEQALAAGFTLTEGAKHVFLNAPGSLDRYPLPGSARNDYRAPRALRSWLRRHGLEPR